MNPPVVVMEVKAAPPSGCLWGGKISNSSPGWTGVNIPLPLLAALGSKAALPICDFGEVNYSCIPLQLALHGLGGITKSRTTAHLPGAVINSVVPLL